MSQAVLGFVMCQEVLDFKVLSWSGFVMCQVVLSFVMCQAVLGFIKKNFTGGVLVRWPTNVGLTSVEMIGLFNVCSVVLDFIQVFCLGAFCEMANEGWAYVTSNK